MMKRENRTNMKGSTAYPTSLQNGGCWFYVESGWCASWEFRKLFPSIKHVDGITIRKRIVHSYKFYL